MKRRAQPWLGTLVDISIADALPEAQLHALFARVFERIGEIHRLMSFHAQDSDVTRINRAPVGSVVQIDPQTMQVIKVALMLTAASASIFSIGCASKLVQWNLLPRHDAAPPPYRADVLAEGLVQTGENRICKTRALIIDLGGIAKGYAVDQAVDVLLQTGVVAACVNAGGDLRVLGSTAYPIAIRNPQSIGEAGRQVMLSNGAMATSATYFSRHQLQKKDVSALIDGRNGAAITSAASATVMAPSCMMADALTKIVLASGDPTHPLLNRFGASAFII